MFRLLNYEQQVVFKEPDEPKTTRVIFRGRSAPKEEAFAANEKVGVRKRG
jgi:hypothetical protein